MQPHLINVYVYWNVSNCCRCVDKRNVKIHTIRAHVHTCVLNVYVILIQIFFLTWQNSSIIVA